MAAVLISFIYACLSLGVGSEILQVKIYVRTVIPRSFKKGGIDFIEQIALLRISAVYELF